MALHSRRYFTDDTNGDKIVEDKGTEEPAVIIQQKNPRKGINDGALEKAEERIKSEVRINDTTRDDTYLEVKNTEDEYDSEPDLSSIHAETFDPIKVINEINTRISTSLTSLEGDDARMLSFKKSNEDMIVSPI